MTTTLVFPAPMQAELRAGLLSRRDVETVATVFARTSGDDGGRMRLLAAEVVWAEDDDYQKRSQIAATLKPVALAADSRSSPKVRHELGLVPQSPV